MKRKLFVLILLSGLLIPIIGVLTVPISGVNMLPRLSVNTSEAARAIASDITLDENSLKAETILPEAVPFWVDMVDADIVPNDGEGVYIAVLDSGLLPVWPWLFSEATIRDDLGRGFSHDVVWNDIAGDFDWGPLREDRGIYTTPWGSGHGTHVTSTIVGYNYGGLAWIRGVAPKASIIPVLVLDYWWLDCPDPNYPGCYDGKVLFRGGTDEMVSAGINYIADLAADLDGPVIISMSLGGPTPSPMIEEAIDYAINQGVIVVVAAGNSGDAGMDWPGAYPQVISAAMGGWTEQWIGWDEGYRWWLFDVDENLKSRDAWGNNHQIFLDYYSSRPNKALGQKSFHLDVTTPGASIVGPYQPIVSWNGEEWVLGGASYYYLWGTSMATPHVSAIASLVLQSYPGYTQSKMEHTLKIAASGLPLASDGAFAIDVAIYTWYFTWSGSDYGSGFLQADAALKAAR
ncbi:MAG: S8 family serine peptidase [Candidatus Heimdallarchaeota archaeon]